MTITKIINYNTIVIKNMLVKIKLNAELKKSIQLIYLLHKLVYYFNLFYFQSIKSENYFYAFLIFNFYVLKRRDNMVIFKH